MNNKNSISQWFSEDVSYQKRLEAVSELGKLFPGFIAPLGHEYKSYGLFAGIYLQTKWQLDSGRDNLPIWFFINQSLTLAPFAYAKEFILDPQERYEDSKYVKKHQSRNSVHAPITQIDTCRAWKEYYHATISGSPFRMLRLLWRAHTISIRHSLWQYQEEFESVLLPREEIAFWQGWILLILSLEKLSPPTNDFFLKPLLDITMPEQAPLGSAQYTIGNQHIMQRLFLRWITKSFMPQHQFLQKYGR